MKTSLIGAAATALLLASAPAQAQTCASLRYDRNLNSSKMFGIAYDYPLTHTSLVVCLSSDGTNDDRAACAATVLIVACLGMGSDYCGDLTSRWFQALARHNYLIESLRARGCAL